MRTASLFRIWGWVRTTLPARARVAVSRSVGCVLPRATSRRFRPGLAFGLTVPVSGIVCGLVVLAVAVNAAPPPEVVERYRATQARHQAKLQDPKLASEYGRACFDLAEYATNNTERAELAEQGIATCRQALAHYKAPRTVVFGPLPKTSTGKIQKLVLRDRARTL